VCGCGAGDAGCEDCGCCKVCAGDLDPHKTINSDKFFDDDVDYLYQYGRNIMKARMDANMIKIKRKVTKKKRQMKDEGRNIYSNLTVINLFVGCYKKPACEQYICRCGLDRCNVICKSIEEICSSW